MAEEKFYHGMTMDYIKDHFYIKFDGTEELSQIKIINGKLSNLWQEASFYYMDTKDQHSRYTKLIDLAKDSLSLERVKENKVLPSNLKMTDKAREAESNIKVFGDMKRIEGVGIVEITPRLQILFDLEDELNIWTEIRSNLKYVAERLENVSMSIGTENKMLKATGGIEPK